MTKGAYKKACAIVLSRQPLQPCGADAWVRKARQAVRWASRNKYCLLTSVGVPTWEMLVAIAKKEGAYQRLIVAADSLLSYEELCRNARQEFDLSDSDAEFAPCIIENKSAKRADLMQLRDTAIFKQADILVLVSVRPKGYMFRLIQDAEKNGKKIIRRHETAFQNRKQALGYVVSPERLTAAIRKSGHTYLIHWTRSTHGPWPGERAIDYYSAIIESKKYPRGAMETLCRIIENKRIKASSRHMPDNIATVSFSSIMPAEFARLMRWRARYREMSFEPYGIGIDKEFALQQGICPVVYYDRKTAIPSRAKPWLLQSTGEITDWRNENEYRCKGDFCLADVPADKIICFCFTQAQARKIKASYGLNALAFCRK